MPATIAISGRLVADPEQKTWQDKHYTRGRVASDSKGGTVFLDFTAWGQPGEFLSEHGRKGSFVVVHGQLRQREHEGRVYYGIEAQAVDVPKTDESTRADDTVPF